MKNLTPEVKERIIKVDGLFWHLERGRVNDLRGTDYYLCILEDGECSWFKHAVYPEPTEFETILATVPKPIQEKLLFHLDLFR